MSEQARASKVRRTTTPASRRLSDGGRVRVMLVAEPNADPGPELTCPDDAVRLMRERMMHLDREHFVAVHIDARNRVLSYEVVSIGHLQAALVHPREVFKAAILANAARILLVHNHPNGDPIPSVQDIQLTRRLMECGEMLGIDVVDHVVVVRDGWASVMENL